MYPRRQLERLAVRKAELQARIVLRRADCMAAASQLAKPLGLVDRGVALWRRVSPAVKLLGVPAVLLLMRLVKRRGGIGAVAARNKVGSLVALAPAVLRGIRMVRGMRAARRPAAAAPA